MAEVIDVGMEEDWRGEKMQLQGSETLQELDLADLAFLFMKTMAPGRRTSLNDFFVIWKPPATMGLIHVGDIIVQLFVRNKTLSSLKCAMSEDSQIYQFCERDGIGKRRR